MHALEITDLHKVYANKFVALDGINITVDEGDFFALLGPNGAGKSTTIGIITSLINKSRGTVKVFGHDIDRDVEQVKSYIGVVPQEFNFNPFETVENIIRYQAGYYGLSYKQAKPTIEQHLTALGLWPRRKLPARMLSGGMKRRLMIARALVHQPKLLILDEPTAGVDIELRRSLWEFIKKINQAGVTIILTTHYLEEAENLCQNVAIINHGKIITDTTMSDLLRQLDKESFIFYVADKISQPLKLDNLTVKIVDEYSLEIELPKKQDLNQVFSQLATQNIRVLSMKNKVSRLEELFMGLTK